mmetsp:Transcript_52996/g.120799  ORF Transcript_52996/g.120799 Transcript_52996/m.120799 type:complete len:530 (-) Transcript_52996:85-1674(-)
MALATGDRAIYKHNDGKEEEVEIKKFHPECEAFSIFVPSLGREKQTTASRLRPTGLPIKSPAWGSGNGASGHGKVSSRGQDLLAPAYTPPGQAVSSGQQDSSPRSGKASDWSAAMMSMRKDLERSNAQAPSSVANSLTDSGETTGGDSDDGSDGGSDGGGGDEEAGARAEAALAAAELAFAASLDDSAAASGSASEEAFVAAHDRALATQPSNAQGLATAQAGEGGFRQSFGQVAAAREEEARSRERLRQAAAREMSFSSEATATNSLVRGTAGSNTGTRGGGAAQPPPVYSYHVSLAGGRSLDDPPADASADHLNGTAVLPPGAPWSSSLRDMKGGHAADVVDTGVAPKGSGHVRPSSQKGLGSKSARKGRGSKPNGKPNGVALPKSPRSEHPKKPGGTYTYPTYPTANGGGGGGVTDAGKSSEAVLFERMLRATAEYEEMRGAKLEVGGSGQAGSSGPYGGLAGLGPDPRPLRNAGRLFGGSGYGALNSTDSLHSVPEDTDDDEAEMLQSTAIRKAICNPARCCKMS